MQGRWYLTFSVTALQNQACPEHHKIADGSKCWMKCSIPSTAEAARVIRISRHGVRQMHPARAMQPPCDPFARVGWAAQDYYARGRRGDSSYETHVWTDDTGNHHTIRTDVTSSDRGVVIITTYTREGEDGFTEEHSQAVMIVARDGSIVVVSGSSIPTIPIRVILVDPDGRLLWEMNRGDGQDGDGGGEEGGDGSQPNPADVFGRHDLHQPRSLGHVSCLVHRSIRLVAEEPVRRRPRPATPARTEVTVPRLASPRVGIEAVINPVDPLWGSGPGGGRRDPSDGPIGPPEP